MAGRNRLLFSLTMESLNIFEPTESGDCQLRLGNQIVWSRAPEQGSDSELHITDVASTLKKKSDFARLMRVNNGDNSRFLISYATGSFVDAEDQRALVMPAYYVVSNDIVSGAIIAHDQFTDHIGIRILEGTYCESRKMIECESRDMDSELDDVGYKLVGGIVDKILYYQLMSEKEERETSLRERRLLYKERELSRKFLRISKLQDALHDYVPPDEVVSISIGKRDKPVVVHARPLRLRMMISAIRDKFAQKAREIEKSVLSEHKKKILLTGLIKEEKREVRDVKKAFRGSKTLPIETESGEVVVENLVDPIDIADEIYTERIRRMNEALKSNRISSETKSWKDQVKEICPTLSSFMEKADFVTPFLDFLYRLYRSRSLLDVVAATYSLLDRLTLYQSCGEEGFFSVYAERFIRAVSNISFRGEVATEALSDRISELKTFVVKFAFTGLFPAIRNLIVSVVSFKLFKKDLAMNVYAWLGKPDKFDLQSLVVYLLEQIQIVVKFGESLWAGVPLDVAMSSANPHATFNASVIDLLAYKDRTYPGLAVDGMMCRREYLLKIKTAIALGKSLYDKMPHRNAEKTIIQKQYLALEAAQLEVQRLMMSTSREPPVAIIIHGTPGVGKSSLLTYMAELFSKVKGRKFDPNQIWHRTLASEYFEAYDPFSQPIIHYSEAGSLHAEIAKKSGDQAIMELTSLIDSLPMPVNMAFEGKGKVFAMPELVLIDTNIPGLNLKHIVNNPAAFERRFLYIEAVVKPEFQKQGGMELDAKKAAYHASASMDRWTFTVTRKVAKDVKRSDTAVIMSHTESSSDIYALTDYLYGVFTDHITVQHDIVEKITKSFQVEQYIGKSKFSGQPITTESGESLELVFTETPVEAIIRIGNMCWLTVEQAFFFLTLTGILSVIWYLPDRRNKSFYLENVIMMGAIVIGLFVSYWKFALICMIVFCFTLSRTGVVAPWRRAYLVSYFEPLRRKAAQRCKDLYIARDNYMESDFWVKYKTELSILFKVLVGSVGAYGLYKLWSSDPPPNDKPYVVSEAHTPFTDCDESTVSVNEFEEYMACGESYKRLPIKGETQLWNTRAHLGESGVHKGDISDLQKRVNRNVRKIMIKETKAEQFILGVKANFALINTHALLGVKEPTISVSNRGVVGAKCLSYATTRLTSDMRRDLGDDLTIIRLNGVLFTDISIHLGDGIYSELPMEGMFAQRVVNVVKEPGLQEMRRKDGVLLRLQLLSYSFPDHYKGACGIPVLVKKGNGSVVAGIHSGARVDESIGYATALVSTKILEAIGQLESEGLMPLHSRGVIEVEALEDPHFKSPFRYEPFHGVSYYGKLPGEALPNQKSRLQKTPFEKEMKEILQRYLKVASFERTSPPLMKPSMINGKYVSPYNNALRKISKQKGSLDMVALGKAVKAYTSFIIKNLEAKGVPTLTPYTAEVAINGVDEDQFIRRINVSTSAGYRFPGLKERYLHKVAEGPGFLTRHPNRQLRRALVKNLEKYKRGVTAGTVTEGLLKDEPRAYSKVLEGKTRMYYASEVDSLLLSRMMLGPFFTLMVQFSEAFGVSIGINMHSGADKFVKELMNFAEKIMAGDFGSFDTSMPVEIGHAVATVIHDVLKHFGYSEEALNIVRGILTDGLFPNIVVLKDLFEAAGLQVSGKYGTAEENSLRCNLLVLYAWFTNPKLMCKNPFEYLKLGSYGDDLQNAVKDEVIGVFNNHTFLKVCEEEILLDYTSSRKDTDLPIYESIYEDLFLKRTFVKREDLDRWVAPLSPDSLFKSVQWILPSQSVTQREQMVSTFESLVWEMTLHLSESEHNEFVLEVTGIFESFYNFRPVFPSFKDITASMFA